MKIKQDSSCTFCKTFEKNICHLFFDCEQVRDLWNNIEIWIFEKKPSKTVIITIKDVLFEKLSKTCILLTKL